MTRRFLREGNKQGIAIAFWLIAMPLFISLLFSCGGDKKDFVDLSTREHIYFMKATDWSMLFSDSGITRYKIDAAEFYIFEEEPEPYWYFPEKVHIEKFDSLFRVEASIDADTAYRYTKKQLVRAVGNVVVESLSGERFETSELYWDQQKEEIYSDKFIKITKGDYVNTGIGFKSNQTLTQYQIYESGAEIPIKRSTADTTKIENTPSP
ncbi:MAG: LPS export ABC transporter periplasmic protein LptC [Tannerella sp.]|jgi:LPS export ABC transporter protein LptC|nr:LPS export ABC transporter periplasmic protein LptC [Tannerella sp.]